MASRNQLARRVAAIERANIPARQIRRVTADDGRVFCVEGAPGVGIWPPWHRLLSDGEWVFLDRLLRRPWPRGPNPSPPWPDWRDKYRAMCRDEAERAMLEAIAAKEPPGTDPLAASPVCSLGVMLVELATLLPEPDEDGDGDLD